MISPRHAQPGWGERGFSLIEVMVVVAIVVLAAGFGYEALAQRPAQSRSSAVAFAGLVSEARALAAVTIDPAVGGGSGATIGVVRDGDGYTATLYAYRPMRAATDAPNAAPHAPPLHTTTTIAIMQANHAVQPPFALFFSPSGHVSAQVPFDVGVDAPLATEPDCPLETGIVIAFVDGVHNQAHSLDCATAQLDLDSVSELSPDALEK